MSSSEIDLRISKRREFGVFLMLVVVLAPLLTFLLASGYGFLFWIWQIINGPPGPAVP